MSATVTALNRRPRPRLVSETPFSERWVPVPPEAKALAEELRVTAGRVALALERATTPASLLRSKADIATSKTWPSGCGRCCREPHRLPRPSPRQRG